MNPDSSALLGRGAYWRCGIYGSWILVEWGKDMNDLALLAHCYVEALVDVARLLFAAEGYDILSAA